MTDVGVVHLVWIPAGLAPLQRFLASYRANPGGIDHDLIVILNGHTSQEELRPFQMLLCDIPHEELILDTINQDLKSYRMAAERYGQRHLCFLNSYTELRAPHWLAKMHSQLTLPGVGVVGASGSWETFVPPLAHERARLATRDPVTKLRGHLRFAYQRIRYPRFPNPHIRTNGFMIARELLLQLRGMTPRNKVEAWGFENFHRNMTRQIQQLGLKPLIVGKDGVGYEIPDWPHSNTFRHGDQSNLLMTDNRTEAYAQGTNAERYAFWIWAWQEEGIPPTPVDPHRTAARDTGLQIYRPISVSFCETVDNSAPSEPMSQLSETRVDNPTPSDSIVKH